jgi:hypothetical protein
MKNATLFLALLLLMFLAPACSKEELDASLVTATKTDNQLVPDKNLEFELELKLDIDPSMDLGSPVLLARVEEVRDSINTFISPEFSLMQEAGRQILRQRGVDPDTAFEGGANDPRLAMIPQAAYILDNLNERFIQNGMTIVDIYYLKGERKGNPTGEGTRGPWDDYWDSMDSDHAMVNHPWDDIHNCSAKVFQEVGAQVAVVGFGAKLLGVTGKALIGFVGGGAVITVGGAIGIAAAGYGLYQMDLCLKRLDIERGITCSITKDLEDRYRKCLETAEPQSEEWKFCFEMLRDLVIGKMRGLDIRLSDTLELVVSEEYTPQLVELINKTEYHGN